MITLIQSIRTAFSRLIDLLAIFLSLIMIFYISFLDVFLVKGHSMSPSLNDGEYLFVYKDRNVDRQYRSGQIVVLVPPVNHSTPEKYIKRVIAVPGDTISFANGSVIVNGELLTEHYLPSSIETHRQDQLENRLTVLNDNEYFVMGDNRPFSMDSRNWGVVTGEMIVGRAWIRIWPLKTISNSN